MKIGLENLNLKKYSKDSIAVLCNQSSVDRKNNHILDILSKHKIKLILSPQHGFMQSEQANMIETASSIHPRYGIPIESLYSENREPKKLDKIDTVICDLQDVGSRYYTYIYTMSNVMKICKEKGITFVVLDRPNPINGKTVEGGVVEKGFESFVGMYPISNRHGMTIGELAVLFNESIGCDLNVINMSNWDRNKYFDEYNRFFINPSPNMPNINTAILYTGMCLLEATNISEGRGTCFPFEIFGAPFIKHESFLKHKLIKETEVNFRPIYFKPTFDKYSGKICSGFHIHILNRKKLNSYKLGLKIIYVLNELYKEFKFNPPPYEYEYKNMPIDILTGSSYFRENINKPISFEGLYEKLETSKKSFLKIRKQTLIY